MFGTLGGLVCFCAVFLQIAFHLKASSSPSWYSTRPSPGRPALASTSPPVWSQLCVLARAMRRYMAYLFVIHCAVETSLAAVIMHGSKTGSIFGVCSRCELHLGMALSAEPLLPPPTRHTSPSDSERSELGGDEIDTGPDTLLDSGPFSGQHSFRLYSG